MKNRSLPYGYMMTNGHIVINPQEQEILMRMFRMYLDGMSLLQISDNFNAEQIEYQPGVIAWNKGRVKRMVEDERYIGNEKFPAIIDKKLHLSLISAKSERNSQKDTDRSAAIFSVNVPVLCPKCGEEMRRRHDPRCVCCHRWVCQNSFCREIIPVSDDHFLVGITAMLNQVINNPDMIIVSDQDIVPSTKVEMLENDIEREIHSLDFDGDSLRKTMFDCASLKYDELDRTNIIGKRLKADFEKSSPLSSFSADLLGRTVQNIHLHPNGTISLTLINGQYIGKEQ